MIIILSDPSSEIVRIYWTPAEPAQILEALEKEIDLFDNKLDYNEFLDELGEPNED